MYESQIKNSFFPNIFFRRPEQFGFVRVCFGFVFTKCLIGFIFIILCNTDVYIHLTLKEFGFVLHNLSLNSLSISPLFRSDMTKKPCFSAFCVMMAIWNPLMSDVCYLKSDFCCLRTTNYEPSIVRYIIP